MLPILPTTIVGSYPQPARPVDHEALRSRTTPRMRAPEIWHMSAPRLAEAQGGATVLAIRGMERAGIDVVTDGEIRRESHSNHDDSRPLERQRRVPLRDEIRLGRGGRSGEG